MGRERIYLPLIISPGLCLTDYGVETFALNGIEGIIGLRRYRVE
jgi:hypothetical protein